MDLYGKTYPDIPKRIIRFYTLFVIHPGRFILKPVTENKTSSGFWEIIKSQFRSELNFFAFFRRRASIFDIQSGVRYVSSDLYTICYGGND